MINTMEPYRWYVDIGSGNGFMPSAINWANVDPDLCRHMASLGLGELII